MSDLMIPHRPFGRSILLAASVVAAAGVSTPKVLAFASAGGGNFFLDTTLRVTHDTNIRGNSLATDDTIFSLRPVLSYERSGGRGTLNVSAGTQISRYQDRDVFDDESLFANFYLNVPPGARTHGSINASYSSGNRVDPFLNDLIDTTQYSIGANGSYQFGGRSTFRLGGNYGHSDPGGFNKSTSRSINVGLGMQVRPDVTGFIDASFGQAESERVTTTGFVTNRSYQSLSVGLDGELTPKLSGNVSVGFQRSEADAFDTGGDDDQVIASVGLTWAARPTTTVSIDASSDASVTGTAQTISSQNLDLTVSQTLGAFFSLTAGGGWRHYTYVGREGSSNDILSASLGLTYNPNQQYAAGINFTTMEHYADEAFRDFSRNTFSIFGSVRF